MGIKTSNFTDIHEADTDQTLPNRASIGLNTSRFCSVNQALYALCLQLWVKSKKMKWLDAIFNQTSPELQTLIHNND